MMTGSVTVRRRTSIVVAAIAIGLSTVGTPTRAAAPPLPESIASIGDSITRATNACCFYGDHPSQSWSTGGNPIGPVRSHYERLLGANPAIAGNAFNDARAGAKMVEADDQAAVAVSQGADYVTILMGANDACTSSPSTMTPVPDFRAQFQAAVETLTTGLPDSHVFVASIPNIRRLWRLFRDDPVARLVWRGARICQSMLSPTNTAADRRAVYERVQQYNAVLGEVCGSYATCRFDGGAVFDYPFTRAHVSRLDYFHPDLDGQAVLAEITWPRSWWPDAA
jgi:lysophospholipase L1-like esterase